MLCNKKSNPLIISLIDAYKVGMVRFELTASTSRTWRANLAALHPAKNSLKNCISQIQGLPAEWQAIACLVDKFTFF